MPRRRIHPCARCPVGREKPATSTIAYSLQDNAYEIDLCDQHNHDLSREFLAWIRLSNPVETVAGARSFFTADSRQTQSRLSELRSRHAEEDREKAREVAAAKASVAAAAPSPPLADLPMAAFAWELSDHAVDRALERGYDVRLVLHTAADPEQTYTMSRHGENVRIHQRGDCAVAVDTSAQKIITVLHRDESRYASSKGA